jgi:excisionase family DNA binding protein
MQTENLQPITFEQLPQAVSLLINEVKELKFLLQTSKHADVEPSDRWFNLQELCDYLPDRPARQTVYGWTAQRLIPFHKKGKKLQFLKSEVDAWLKADKRKTATELQAEAIQFINAKRGGLK